MIYAVLARDKNNLIGNGNFLPWKDDFSVKWDMENFKNLTKGNIVFMGFKTFLSLKNPLPGRINVVESRDFSNVDENFIFTASLSDFLKKYEKNLKNEWREKKIFIIGGAATITKYAGKIKSLYLTTFYGAYKGDIFLPKEFLKYLEKNFIFKDEIEIHKNGKIELFKRARKNQNSLFHGGFL